MERMNFSGLRIGFVPFSKSLVHPFDLRNFIYYARKRGIKFENAEPEGDYDVVVLPPLADLSVWSRYPRGRTKLIFMCVDSYLATARFDLKEAFRGVAKYVGGEHKHLRLSYAGALKDMCRRADAVVCSTLEQQHDILQYCNNVHIILESHCKVVREVKTDYAVGDRVNLVWEGRPENMHGLAQIKGVLCDLRKQYPIALHVITDLVYKKYMNKIGTISIVEEIQRIFGEDYHPYTVGGNDSLVYLYQWNLEMFSRIVTGCDVAVIPLDIQDSLRRGKPENKLLLFWRMGMPTIASSTPAYARAMEKCGLNLCCNDQKEWADKLEHLVRDCHARKEAGTRGKECAETVYSEDRYLEQWDALFQSVLK